MPGGTVVIDQQETFAAAPIAMSAGPKLEFGSDTQQAVTRDGEKRWQVICAVQYRPDGKMPGGAEVITVSITGGEDPGLTITPGTPVEFNKLRMGVSGVSAEERKDGRGTRVSGGKPFWGAAGVRPAGAQSAAAA